MTLEDLGGSPLCPDCVRDLTTAVNNFSTLRWVFERLQRGPATYTEGTVDSLFGGARLWSGDRQFEIGGALYCAAHIPFIHREVDLVAGLFSDDEDELLAYGAALLDRWQQWFTTIGAEQLVLLNRLAGPDAPALDDGFLLRPPLDDLGRLRAGSVDAVFKAFAGAHLSGVPGPVGETVDLLLATPNLFGDRFVNASVDEIRALLDEVSDLADLTGKVRDTANRRDVEALVDRFSSRVLPDPGREGRRLVVAAEEIWSCMFWAEALGLCFETTEAGGYVLSILPDGLAERVVASVLAIYSDPSAWSAPLPESMVVTAEMMATVGALVGDGMSVDDAFAVTLAVVPN